MRDDIRRIVETGYDSMADRFAEWQGEVVGSTRFERVEELLELLPDRPDVLELGVGAGVRSTRMLAERGAAHRGRRVERAARPGTTARADRDLAARGRHGARARGRLLRRRRGRLRAQPRPAEELGPLLRRVAGWLRPGGYFLATFATEDNPGWTGEWLGVEMYFAGLPPAKNRSRVEAAGLEIVSDDIEVSIEPEGEARFQWLLARRPE